MKTGLLNSICRGTILFLVILLFSFYKGGVVQGAGASLYLSPSSGSYTIGQTFAAGVYVSSASQSMNAVSGIVSYPQDKLQYVSLSKSGSIINLWVQEPSQSAGKINFEGIVLNPGYQGSTGKILTINFKVKAAGSASLSFNSGSILANDGLGTNILGGLGGANFTLNAAAAAPAPSEVVTPIEKIGAPIAPKISSSTHPDSDKWYPDKNPKFEWSLAPDITAVNVLADRGPTTNPGTKSDGFFNIYQFENVDEGTWYFHLRLKNAAGWGSVSHFRFQIDSTPPLPFKMKFSDGNKITNPRSAVLLEARDEVSGIDHYEIKISNSEFVVLEEIDKTKNLYQLPRQGPGRKTIIIKAVDKAGNSTLAMAELEILSIETPEITKYSPLLEPSDILSLSGTAVANIKVNVYLQKDYEEKEIQTTISTVQGKWFFVYDKKLRPGIYKIWVEAEDREGAKSELSRQVTIGVEKPAFIRVGGLIIDFLATAITVLVLILALIFIFLYIYVKIRTVKKRIFKETKEAEDTVHKTFKALRKMVGKEQDGVKKKSGRHLKRSLDVVEGKISKEIKDIKKNLK